MEENNSATIAQTTTAPVTTTEVAPAVASQPATQSSSAGLLGNDTQTNNTVSIPDNNTKSNDPWYSSIKDEDARGYAELRGYESADDMVKAFKSQAEIVEANKLGKAVVMPDDPTDIESMNKFYDALGRPAKPEDYGIKAPEGESNEFANNTQQWFHEAGLTAKQAQVIADKWNSHFNKQMETTNHQKEVEQRNGEDAFRRDRGSNADRDIELARRAAKNLLAPGEDVKLYEAFGSKRALEIMNKIGAGTMEHTFHSDKNPVNEFGLTPEGARVRKAELLADPVFKASYLSGDKAKRDQITNLTRIAG